jgi:hypothetical protein
MTPRSKQKTAGKLVRRDVLHLCPHFYPQGLWASQVGLDIEAAIERCMPRSDVIIVPGEDNSTVFEAAHSK